jgi:putative ATP-dependent endonuclease of OLD family
LSLSGWPPPAGALSAVQLFIAAQPSQHLVPHGRLGTGSITLLVFALLTLIAELKDKQSVIFAMEEPEIASRRARNDV